MEKDGVIYASPKCSKTRKAIVSSLFLLMVILLSSLIGGIVISAFLHIPNITISPISLFVVFLACFGGIIFMRDVSRSGMYPHIKIYKNGITPPLYHTTPFSDCDKLERTKTQTRLIKWDEILCFETRNKEDRGTKQITVFLDVPRRAEAYGLDRMVYFNVYHKELNKDVDALSIELKKHNIKEISPECPNCGKVSYFPSRDCTYCGTKRF